MKFSIRFADQIVGALVILALAILVVVIFMLGKNQRWFVRDYDFITYLESASGVSKNMPIQYKGFKIGEVNDFELANDDRVKVSFIIYKEHSHRVKEGSLIEMQSSMIPMLGSGFVFHPGGGQEVIREGKTLKTDGISLIPEGNVIPEIKSFEAIAYKKDNKTNAPEEDNSINNIILNVNTLLETINASLSGTGSKDLPIGKLLNDISGAIEQITGLLENLDPALKQVSNPSGTVMSILDGQGEFYKGIEKTINSLAGTVEGLNKTVAFLPENLPQIVVLINQLETTIEKVNDLLISLSNNPLLKGGIPEKSETGPGGAGSRNQDFTGGNR